MGSQIPFVGLPADTLVQDDLLFHKLGDKYARAISQVTRAHPLLIPSMGCDLDLNDLVEGLDGLVITGAVANVHPSLFGAEPTPAHEPYDHARDASTFPLIELALKKEIPLFCICRGHQELNVVMGGTIDTEIQEFEGRDEHRGIGESVEERYAPKHNISIAPGGVLHDILGKSETMVNTVHRQAISRLGNGLIIEATAEDGTIEAVSVAGAKGYNISVQWHPEYRASENQDSVKLFEAFGDAVRARFAARSGAEVKPAPMSAAS
ncbi:MAG: gamma-glutamyl-gamma-aminobutyrate hydrolase family protein [Hyphomicrobiales bacterium]